MNPYKELDVPIDATDEEIKDSYRELAKDLRPDVGGDAEKFKSVSNAYAILKSPEKRRRYDAGEAEPEVNPQSQAIFVINQLVTEILDTHHTDDIIYIDIVGTIKSRITTSEKELSAAIKKLKAEVAKLDKMAEIFKARLKSKKAKNNLFKMALSNKRQQVQRELNIHLKSKAVFDAALKLTKDYEFTFDEKPQRPDMPSYFTFTNPSTSTSSSIFG